MLKRYAVKLVWILALLVTAAAIAHASSTYVGSRHSNKYHYPTCKAALRIKPDNLVSFSSAKEARAAGYLPCKVCQPPLVD